MPTFDSYPAAGALADADILLVLQGLSTRQTTLGDVKAHSLAGGSFKGNWLPTKSYVVGDIVSDVTPTGGLWRCIVNNPYLGAGFPTFNPPSNDKWVTAETKPEWVINDYPDPINTVAVSWMGDRKYNRVSYAGDDDLYIIVPNFNPTAFSPNNFPVGGVIRVRNANIGSSSMTIIQDPDEGVAILYGNPVVPYGHNSATLVYLGDNKWDIIH